MARQRSFSLPATFPFFCILSLFVRQISAVVLQDLPHLSESTWNLGSSKLVRRKADFSTLQLKSEEIFSWGGFQQSQAVLANLTVFLPEAQQSVLSLQRFKEHLLSIQCTNETIDLEFKDKEAVEYAQKWWAWVNGAENHNFVLVAGTGDCIWNEHRLPFVVSSLEFNQGTNGVHLKAKASRWDEAFHTYTLRVGDVPLSKNKRQLVARSTASPSSDLSFGFEYKLPNAYHTWDFPYQGRNVSLKMDCDDCGTHGRFKIGLNAETVRSKPLKVEAFVKPIGVSARMVPKLTLSTNLTSSIKLLDKEWPGIPFEGLTIPGGILSIGPAMIYSIGAEGGPLVASTSLSGGVVASLDNSATMTYDLLAGKPFAQSGWSPKIAPREWILDGKVSGDLKMFGRAKFQVTAKALGQEYSMGISLTPHTSAKLDVVASFGGPACPEDPTPHGYGVKFTPKFGAGVKLEALNSVDKSHPLMDHDFGSIEQDVPGMCFAFGEPLPTSVSQIVAVTPTDKFSPAAGSTQAGPILEVPARVTGGTLVIGNISTAATPEVTPAVSSSPVLSIPLPSLSSPIAGALTGEQSSLAAAAAAASPSNAGSSTNLENTATSLSPQVSASSPAFPGLGSAPDHHSSMRESGSGAASGFPGLEEAHMPSASTDTPQNAEPAGLSTVPGLGSSSDTPSLAKEAASSTWEFAGLGPTAELSAPIGTAEISIASSSLSLPDTALVDPIPATSIVATEKTEPSAFPGLEGTPESESGSNSAAQSSPKEVQTEPAPTTLATAASPSPEISTSPASLPAADPTQLTQPSPLPLTASPPKNAPPASSAPEGSRQPNWPSNRPWGRPSRRCRSWFARWRKECRRPYQKDEEEDDSDASDEEEENED